MKEIEYTKGKWLRGEEMNRKREKWERQSEKNERVRTSFKEDTDMKTQKSLKTGIATSKRGRDR